MPTYFETGKVFSQKAFQFPSSSFLAASSHNRSRSQSGQRAADREGRRQKENDNLLRSFGRSVGTNKSISLLEASLSQPVKLTLSLPVKRSRIIVACLLALQIIRNSLTSSKHSNQYVSLEKKKLIIVSNFNSFNFSKKPFHLLLRSIRGLRICQNQTK